MESTLGEVLSDGLGRSGTRVVEHAGSVDLATRDGDLLSIGIIVVSKNKLHADNSFFLEGGVIDAVGRLG